MRSRLSLRDGIANHLITISPDAIASAMDNADALASGLKSVEKRIRELYYDRISMTSGSDEHINRYGCRVSDQVFHQTAG